MDNADAYLDEIAARGVEPWDGALALARVAPSVAQRRALSMIDRDLELAEWVKTALRRRLVQKGLI